MRKPLVQEKILFISENRTWGGSELLWSRALIHLASKKKYVVGACIFDLLELPLWFQESEKTKTFFVKRVAAPTVAGHHRILNRFLPEKSKIREKDQRYKFLKIFKPDLLIINQGLNFNGIDTMEFASQIGIPYVTVSHAVNEFLWPDYNLAGRMRKAFANSLENYFVSNDNLETTQIQTNFKLPNSAVIRNPFNVPFHSEANYPHRGNYTLACVGRFEVQAKGQDVLLRVLAQPKWTSRNLTVNFYGEGKDEKYLKELIVYLGLKNVKIRKFANPKEIWSENQGLILTSRFEGLPLVIVEASLCERLVIVTDVSGNSELVSDNITGFVASAPRVKYVDEALERAWKRRNEWKEIGEKAGEFVRHRVSERPEAEFGEKLVQWLAKG